MTALIAPATYNSRTIVARITWHRPLLALAIAMLLLAIWSAIGIGVDPRLVTGAPLWAKPLKFAVSICVYSLTLSGLIGLLTRGRRLAWWMGTVAAIFLAVEIVIIVGSAFSGSTSHFNVSTPLRTVLWGIMAISIVVVWSAAIPLAVILFRSRLGDPARTVAIRAGLIIALAGMALGFLMTFPTAAQIADYHGIVGAHSVGIPDGGPGLPLLGWSTVGGDLRIPHFVGMHALQLIPLAVLILEVLSRRFRVLREASVRRGITWTVVALYIATVAILTVQAELGQSIVHPGVVTIATTVLVIVGSAAAIGIIVARSRLAAVRPTTA